jgi:hypothetical protein
MFSFHVPDGFSEPATDAKVPASKAIGAVSAAPTFVCIVKDAGLTVGQGDD